MSLLQDENLVEFLKQEASEHLRSVIRYDDDEYDFLYIREDITSGYEFDEFARVVDDLRTVEQFEVDHTSRLKAGNHHVTMRLYDRAAILHFGQGETFGTVVSLDSDAAENFAGFVGACLKHLYRDSPQSIENAPRWV
ncbi:hypothetical protein SAMN04487949_2149 [Halogranum gelatinilyticum]|uniref:Uncharacterized protein n=1 Tax=Halogranum gelatinilyticum TaxID=660521 RepID=A0A1G9UDG9_9EURY|nr:hypothetical protein [Halogranum gelatinilyticum]SDM58007.1 hypothetical protein SAMN04487949_2149 [Halogranum gelatinilyticum]